MEPKIHKTRTPVTGMEPLEVADVNDTPDDIFMDSFFEDDNGFVDAIEHKEVLEQQKQRIEALKRAIDIAKLMSNVTTDDVITIADKVLDYMKNTKI